MSQACIALWISKSLFSDMPVDLDDNTTQQTIEVLKNESISDKCFSIMTKGIICAALTIELRPFIIKILIETALNIDLLPIRRNIILNGLLILFKYNSFQIYQFCADQLIGLGLSLKNDNSSSQNSRILITCIQILVLI